MIDTNTLLSIGFSIVSNFASVVEIPDHAVPASTGDLRKYIVGSPRSPVDLFLWDRRGTRFWIREGAVYEFCTPGSYRENSDQGASRFQGEAKLSSDEAVNLAVRTLWLLTKGTSSAVHSTPSIRQADSRGQKLPFYWLAWPLTDPENPRAVAAAMEVDARSGLITFLELKDKSFADLAMSQQVTNRAYTPDPPRPSRWALRNKAPLQRVLSYPTTNQVVDGIASWLRLCRRLGVDPGTETNLASVFWPQTFVYTNRDISAITPICRVQFANGALFDSINGVAFSHFASDACFTGFWTEMTREERDLFRGKILKHWEDLEKVLEKVLVERVGIPPPLMKECPASPYLYAAKFGTEDMKRTIIGWGLSPRSYEVEIPIYAFTAEFDLETGELKWISFHDRRFIGALREAQSKSK